LSPVVFGVSDPKYQHRRRCDGERDDTATAATSVDQQVCTSHELEREEPEASIFPAPDEADIIP